MKKFFTILALLVCVGSVSAVLLQRQQLLGLRAQRQAQDYTAPAASADRAKSSESNTDSAEATTAELLQLRSEVTRLNTRKRELDGVAAENDRLRAQLATGQANGSTEGALPAGYIRKAQAQMKGYSSPENTLQTFLWALHHHDTAALLQALTPTQAQQLRSQLEQSSTNPARDIFKQTEPLPGLAIVAQTPQPDGSVDLQVTVVPDVPPSHFRAELVNGEWKLNMGGTGF
jgi:hypothetical protein